MVISHPRGLYTIMVDADRRIVYEAPVGLWTKDDYMEYHNLYLDVILPALGAGEWSICTDYRKYRMSNVEEVLDEHINWLSENNVKYSGMVVDSAIIRMQINKAVGSRIPQQAFLDEAEADMWLKSKGF